MKKFKYVLDKVLEVLLSISILSMVFVAILGVVTRLILKNQASFTTEFLRYALLWTSLFAGAYCFGEKGHISITFVKDKFSEETIRLINIVIEVVIMAFALMVLVYGGYQGVVMGMNEMSPTLHVKVGYIYTALPISGIFITFYSLINIIEYVKGENKSTA